MTNEDLLNLRGAVGLVTTDSPAAIILHMTPDGKVQICTVGLLANQAFLQANLQMFLSEVMAGRIKHIQEPVN